VIWSNNHRNIQKQNQTKKGSSNNITYETVALPNTAWKASRTGLNFTSLSDATIISTSPPESEEIWKYNEHKIILLYHSKRKSITSYNRSTF
jgi:hypothetical protein